MSYGWLTEAAILPKDKPEIIESQNKSALNDFKKLVNARKEEEQLTTDRAPKTKRQRILEKNGIDPEDEGADGGFDPNLKKSFKETEEEREKRIAKEKAKQAKKNAGEEKKTASGGLGASTAEQDKLRKQKLAEKAAYYERLRRQGTEMEHEEALLAPKKEEEKAVLTEEKNDIDDKDAAFEESNLVAQLEFDESFNELQQFLDGSDGRPPGNKGGQQPPTGTASTASSSFGAGKGSSFKGNAKNNPNMVPLGGAPSQTLSRPSPSSSFSSSALPKAAGHGMFSKAAPMRKPPDSQMWSMPELQQQNNDLPPVNPMLQLQMDNMLPSGLPQLPEVPQIRPGMSDLERQQLMVQQQLLMVQQQQELLKLSQATGIPVPAFPQMPAPQISNGIVLGNVATVFASKGTGKKGKKGTKGEQIMPAEELEELAKQVVRHSDEDAGPQPTASHAVQTVPGVGFVLTADVEADAEKVMGAKARFAKKAAQKESG